MSCGCGIEAASKPQVSRNQAASKPHGLPGVIGHVSVRARAVLCHCCIYAERHETQPWTIGAIACTVSGKPIESHLHSPQPTCPKGKHPDAQGIVRFPFGLKRAGVPKEFRWLLRRRLTGPLPGCGCFIALLKLRSFLLRHLNGIRAGKSIPSVMRTALIIALLLVAGCQPQQAQIDAKGGSSSANESRGGWSIEIMPAGTAPASPAPIPYEFVPAMKESNANPNRPADPAPALVPVNGGSPTGPAPR